MDKWAQVMMAIILLAGVSCNSRRYLPPAGQPHAGNIIELLLDPAHESGLDLAAPAAVKDFYQRRTFAPVWVDANGRLPAADSMIRLVRRAPFYGLFPEDYHLEEIDTLLKKPAFFPELSRLDILLTDNFFALWRHLKYGLLQGETLARVPGPPAADAAIAEALIRAVTSNTVRPALEGREPSVAEYGWLKAALKNGLDNRADSGSPLYPDTLKKLVINMERWRWESDRLPDEYLMVNIPAFTLRVMHKNDIRLESRIIVGAPETPTPRLSSVIECFLIYPYWHVPRKIATKEILPLIQNDSGYIQRHHFDVLDRKGTVLNPDSIDWGRYHENYFPFILRQREGPENTLGVLKFIFDNPYAVYLHDTNAKRLFGKEYRALSHGCVRLEKARELAGYLVGNDSLHYGADDLDQYITMRKRIEIVLTDPMPVYIRYFTCAAHQGAVVCYEDIYGLDDALLRALYPEAFIEPSI